MPRDRPDNHVMAKQDLRMSPESSLNIRVSPPQFMFLFNLMQNAVMSESDARQVVAEIEDWAAWQREVSESDSDACALAARVGDEMCKLLLHPESWVAE